MCPYERAPSAAACACKFINGNPCKESAKRKKDMCIRVQLSYAKC